MTGGNHPLARAALPVLFLACAATAWAKIDADGNGMSDVWETAYGESLVPAEDPDHDGFSNLLESIAGTDPADGKSFPKVERLELHPDTLRQVWKSVTGVQYQPLFSTDLGTWAPFGPVVIGDGGEMELTIDRATAFTSGGVEHLVWEGLTGWGLSQIKDRIADQTPPSVRGRLTSLDIPQTAPDRDYFGQWISGWIIPPETGAYQFFIASDDQSELWLSTDKSTANKRQIASVAEWTSHQEWDKFPSQASAAITLTANTPYYFEAYQVEGNGGDNLSVAWQRPSMAEETREIIGGAALSSTGLSLAEMGAERLFSRMEISDADRDGDGVTDYEERLLGLDPFNATTTPRVADLDAARKTLDSPSSVNLGVSVARGYESTGSPAEFIVFRAGGIAPVTVHYTVSGTAQAATDYLTLSGSVVIPAGARSVKIPVIPIADGEVEPQESVTLTLQPGAGFTLGTPATATVQLDDSPDVLFIAQLRGTDTTPSAGTGVAAVTRSGNALTGQTSLSFGGLGDAQSGAEIFVSDDGVSGPVVFSYPPAQVPGLPWDFVAAGGLTRDQIIAALDANRLWVRVLSGTPGTAELVDRLLPAPGWDQMPVPPTPPAAPEMAANVAEAARFLTQA
ncbi:MAG: hypothetical protein EOP87_14380, partial [Verrucomicrobiaceae bacterium]